MRSRYYTAARVVRVNADGSYVLKFDGGTIEQDVPNEAIRAAPLTRLKKTIELGHSSAPPRRKRRARRAGDRRAAARLDGARRSRGARAGGGRPTPRDRRSLPLDVDGTSKGIDAVGFRNAQVEACLSAVRAPLGGPRRACRPTHG